jgi:hypothetical protein
MALSKAGLIDLNGNELVLDADADTSISVDTDDRIDFKIAGTDVMKITNSSSNVRIDAVTSDKDVIFGGLDGASARDALTLDISDNGAATFNDKVFIYDDKGIVFGTGGDWMIGAAAGESTLEVFAGTDNTVGTDEGQIQFKVGDSAESYVLVSSGEGNTSLASYYFYGDQGDDSDDTWRINANQGSCGIDVGMNTIRENIKFDGNGNGYADATWQDNSFDYAELFEWKTHLSNDSDINALWGKTVVLDGDKVKLAESGDEANVIGVIRPKGSTNSHGDGLQWGGKWKKDVWGNYETEGYTRITWQEEKGYRHSYPKDRIPTHRLKKSVCEDKDIHKKESSFELDNEGNKIPVIVPNTAEEKTAANYVERTHKKGKADVPLKRRIYNDSYNPATAYNRRQDRLKEWVLIGMLGQVPVRDSAIIPTHWKKMKNLESGIDKYFIFNK